MLFLIFWVPNLEKYQVFPAQAYQWKLYSECTNALLISGPRYPDVVPKLVNIFGLPLCASAAHMYKNYSPCLKKVSQRELQQYL